jgi:ABC-type uncharacterized transport system auxiliary subunit
VSVRSLLAALLLASGCLAPRQPADPRYFTPAAPPIARDGAARSEVGPELRLRRVFGAPYLRDRMVWRRGVELGFSDLLRWTEPPENYVQARLEQELFVRRGLRRVTRPGAPALTVELLAFDDVLEPTHEAWVTLSALLTDPSQAAFLERTLSVRRPIAGDRAEDIALALGEALSQAVEDLGGEVQAALEERQP